MLAIVFGLYNPASDKLPDPFAGFWRDRYNLFPGDPGVSSNGHMVNIRRQIREEKFSVVVCSPFKLRPPIRLFGIDLGACY